MEQEYKNVMNLKQILQESKDHVVQFLYEVHYSIQVNDPRDIAGKLVLSQVPIPDEQMHISSPKEHKCRQQLSNTN